MMRAKQRYLNSFANGALTTYDEKVMAEMTVYGLPMLKVNMPVQSAVAPGNAGPAVMSSSGGAPAGSAKFDAQGHGGAAAVPQASTATTYTLPFAYTPHVVSAPIRSGTYDTVNGGDELHIAGGRPVLPRTGISLDSTTDMAHGVLMVGGDFADTPNFDPVVSNIITQEMTLDTEGVFPLPQLYPSTPAFINRFLVRGGTVRQRLVVVPAQFQATNTVAPTLGTLRRYNRPGSGGVQCGAERNRLHCTQHLGGAGADHARLHRVQGQVG